MKPLTLYTTSVSSTISHSSHIAAAPTVANPTSPATLQWCSRASFLSIALLACLAAGSSVLAQDLVSRPSGYIRVDLSPGEQRLTSTPFDPFDDTLHLPDGVRVLEWDTASASYLEPDSNTLTFVEGWLVNDSSATQTVFLAGSVVLDETRTIVIPPALSIIGYPFSSAISFTNTELGLLMQSASLPGDQLTDPAGALTVDGVLQPGRGYWYEHATTNVLTIDEPRPYDNPFGEVDTTLAITSTVATVNGLSLGLAIPADCTLIDLFIKDMSNTNAVALDVGWSLLETIAPSNIWTVNTPPLTANLYLLARADIDLDHNGIPDARERFIGEGASSLLPDYPVEIPACESVESSDFVTVYEPTTGSNLTFVVDAVPRSVSTRIIYVNADTGSDVFTGRQEAAENGDGPKRTIMAGVRAAGHAGQVNIAGGHYPEKISLAGINVRVRFTGNVSIRETPATGAISPLPSTFNPVVQQSTVPTNGPSFEAEEEL